MVILWQRDGLDEKLKSLRSKGKLAVVTDFDRTLTHGTCVECHLLVAHSAKVHESHPETEKDLKMLAEVSFLPVLDRPEHLREAGWWVNYHDTMKERGIRDHHIENAVGAHDEALFRPGVASFYEACRARDVPFVVVSAGLTNVVHWSFKKEISHLPVPHIVANYLNSDGDVLPDRQPITSSGKQQALSHAPEDLKETLKACPVTLVLGDKPNDSLVACQHPREICPDSDHHILSVGLFNATNKYPLDSFKEVYDVVLDGMHESAFDCVSDLLTQLFDSE